MAGRATPLAPKLRGAGAHPNGAAHTGWLVQPTPQWDSTLSARFDQQVTIATEFQQSVSQSFTRANELLAEIAAKPSGPNTGGGSSGGSGNCSVNLQPLLAQLQLISSNTAALLPVLNAVSSRLATISNTLSSVNAAQSRTTNAVEQQSGATRILVQQLADQLGRGINSIPPAITSSGSQLRQLLLARDGSGASGSAYWLAAIARHLRLA